jgi:hypothetical protein
LHPTGNKKPFVNTNGEEGAEDRHVVAQPNKFGLKYNLRKLKNLPYHLAKAGRLQQLGVSFIGGGPGEDHLPVASH